MELKKILKITIIALSVIMIGIVIYFVLGIASLGVGTCKNKMMSEALSSNNYYNAIYFVRNCGATTGYSSQVKLSKLRNKKLFSNNE